MIFGWDQALRPIRFRKDKFTIKNLSKNISLNKI